METCIRLICVDRDDAANVADDFPDPDIVVLLVRGRTLPGARVTTHDLLGLDLSRHPSVYLCANEV